MLVWKELDYGSMGESEKQMLVSEVNLLRELKHPNIVRYYDRVIDRSNTTLYIVMEYCEGGDLASLISKCIKDRRYLEESFVLHVLVQLALALRECHRRSDDRITVLHRDLKPANIFLDARHNVKLGDFGLARILHHDTSFAKTFVGTPYYMSPEQMNRTSYNEKSDIWSLGCLLYELCALFPPFTAFNQRELAEKIREGRFRRIPYRYSEELNTLLSKMLHLKDYLRPSVESILQSSLLSEAVSEEQKRTHEKVQEKAGKRSAGSKSTTTPSWPPMSDAELRLKEQAVRKKERALKEREFHLEKREQELCVREQMSNEKLSRAESLLKAYNLLHRERVLSPRAHRNIDLAENTSPGKKKVQFASESKENIRPAVAMRSRQAAHLCSHALDDMEQVCQTRSRQILGLR